MKEEKAENPIIAGISESKERQIVFDDNVSRLNISASEAKKQYSNLDLAKKRVGYIRHKAINGLEKYLIEFEANIERNGAKVVWALDDQEAVKVILEILKKHQVNYITKSKSLIADEIDLYSQLAENNVVCEEVNIGEFILRLSGNSPRHLSSLLVEKSLSQINEVLAEKNIISSWGKVSDSYIAVIKNRKEAIRTSTASINGANFLIADTGSVCVSEDAGEAVLNSVLPDVQIIIAGIDKMIPSLMNLDVLLPLYSTYSTGERINTFNTIISGPRAENETDGPKDMYVILLDNGRSNVLAQKYQRRALSCIDCGACQNVCPVYRKIGGEGYDTTYCGPVGSVITPWMKGIEEYNSMSYLSTLCGLCTEACPVMINLHDLLLYNRRDGIQLKNRSFSESLVMEGWHQVLKSRKWMDWPKYKWKNLILKKLYVRRWVSSDHFPEVRSKNFKNLWEERREGKIK